MAAKKLPNDALVSEILQKVSSAKTKKEKVELLQEYNNNALRAILIINFDESLEFLLPEGEVPYSGFDDQRNMNLKLSEVISDEVRRMHEVGSFSLGSTDKEGHTTIRREAKHFYRFVKGGDDAMNAIRRETMFINILEGLHPLEAEIVVLVKDGKLEDRYKITKDVVATAYPDIVWGDA